ncbi:MAG: TonB-dependent receptor, partial [Moraxellaceae bacterium]|nr:TonB-dependent receptor [Moraxellaceae bacterium]
DTVWRGPIHYRRTGTNDNQVKNHAVYVFDTMKLSPQWEFNTGVRYERNEASYVTRAFDAATGAQTSVTPGESNEDLVSGRVGLVFKPVENGSVYVAAGNSLAPSASTVIAGCTATGNNQNCNVDPEKTVNYELGTKWDLLDSRLALTAALFRNDRTNVRVNDLVTTDPQVLDGRQRVDGFDIGASGKITSNWAISAAYAFLDSEVLQGAAAGAPVDSQKGQDIAGTPRHSGNVWTTYLLPKGIELGYGIRYVGEYYTEAAAVTTTVPDYTLHNAMIGYAVTRDLSLRLNLNNLTDEVYWSAVRPHGWGNPGEGRSAVLSLNYNLR